MLLNPQPRKRVATFDYLAPESDVTQPLPLVRRRWRLPIVLDKRGLAGARGEDEHPRVPRLSLLLELEHERSEDLRRVRRRYIVALLVAFAVGIAAGVVGRSPEFRAGAASIGTIFLRR